MGSRAVWLVAVLLLAVALSMPVHAALTDDLIRWYGGDEVSCETESTSGEFNLTAQNGATCAVGVSKFGARSYNVSNTGDVHWSALSDGLATGTGESTAICWVNFRSANANNNAVLGWGPVSGDAWRYFGIQPNSSASFYVNGGNDFYGGPMIPTGSWHMLGFRYNGSTGSLVMNDSLLGNVTYVSTTDLSEPMGLGHQFFFNNQDPEAYIDGCGIWNRSLSSSEIAELWNNGDGLDYPFGNDTTAPVCAYTNISISHQSAIIQAACNEPANLTVRYGLTDALGTVLTNASFVATNTVNISGLSPSTTYFWNATSCDSGGFCGNSTTTFNFTTQATPDFTAPIFNVSTFGVTNSSFGINVVADEAVNITVRYGTDWYILSSAANGTFAQNVTLNITGLEKDTAYLYNVTAICDASGNCNQSLIQRVRTLQNPATMVWTQNTSNISVGFSGSPYLFSQQFTAVNLTPACAVVNYSLVRPDDFETNFTIAWDYEEALNDTLGNYDGSVFVGNPSYPAGKVGKAISVPTINDRIAVSSGPDFTGTHPITVSIWWQPGINFVNGTRLWEVPESGSFGYFGCYYDEAWLPWKGFSCSWGDGVAYSGHSIFPMHVESNGSWYHVVGVFDKVSGVTEMYVNGVKGEVLDTQATFGVPTTFFGLGEPGMTGRTGTGLFDMTYLWMRNFTEDEVRYLYNQGVGRAANFTYPAYELNVSTGLLRLPGPNATIVGTEYLVVQAHDSCGNVLRQNLSVTILNESGAANVSAYGLTCAGLTYPSADDLPSTAKIGVNFTVFSPTGFAGNETFNVSVLGSVNSSVNVSGCTVSSPNGTSNVYNCSVPMRYFYAPGNYSSRVDGVSSAAQSFSNSTGSICQYGELVATQRLADVVGFPTAAPGVSNAPGDTPVVLRNTGNAILNLSLTAYDLVGQQTPSVRLAASAFKAGLALGNATVMQNGTQRDLNITLGRGVGLNSSILLWVSMPSNQTSQQYVSVTPWSLEASG